MSTQYILIDFENVQPKSLEALGKAPFKIKVFLGAKQQKIPLELARALQSFGEDAEYVQIEGSGPNAVDFHIAYYLGCLSAATPDAAFHIISKDSGFDPLVKHLRGAGVNCNRCGSIPEILTKAVTAENLDGLLHEVIAHLEKMKAARPRTVKTLTSTVKAHLRKKSPEVELELLLERLQERGVVKVKDGKVSYELPHEP